MDKLKELFGLMQASGSLEFNPHKAYYETAKSYLFEQGDPTWDAVGDIDLTRDIWELTVYPNTPVSFIRGVSNDLDALLDWAISACR